MSLTFRFLWTLVYSQFQKRITMFEETTMTFRTMPDDCDFNGHMNNGRYLSIMDFGRINLTFRLGIVGKLLRAGYLPVIGSAHIRFRQSLKPFRTFTLRTRVLGWDEKWMYLEQRFEKNGEVMAIGTVKAIFKGKKGSVPTPQLFREMGVDATSPPLPDQIKVA